MYPIEWSRDSAVDAATDYGLYGRGVEVRITVRVRLSSLHVVQTGFLTQPASHPMVPGALSPALNWPGCEADRSHPNNAKIKNILIYIECYFCRLIRRPEHLMGRHWCLPANWRPFFRWSPDQWVSQCYVIEFDRSFYCALFCVFITRVSQCPIRLRSENTLHTLPNKSSWRGA
jgi:hypothetical protein